jgi:hypothetical protein
VNPCDDDVGLRVGVACVGCRQQRRLDMVMAYQVKTFDEVMAYETVKMVLGRSVWGSRYRVKDVHLDDGAAEGDIVADGAVVRTLLAGVAEEGHGGGGGKGAGIGVGPAEGAAVSEEGVLLLDTEPWVLVLGLYTATGFGAQRWHRRPECLHGLNFEISRGPQRFWVDHSAWCPGFDLGFRVEGLGFTCSKISLAKERVEVGMGVMSGLSICAPKITVRSSGFPLFEYGSHGRIQGFQGAWQRTRNKQSLGRETSSL